MGSTMLAAVPSALKVALLKSKLTSHRHVDRLALGGAGEAKPEVQDVAGLGQPRAQCDRGVRQQLALVAQDSRRTHRGDGIAPLLLLVQRAAANQGSGEDYECRPCIHPVCPTLGIGSPRLQS